MPLTAIPGTFRILGASPDGDSIRFYPDDPGAFAAAGLRARVNAAGGAQLRLEGIDALETHYTPRSAPRPWRQPAALGDAAGAALLDILGFSGVLRDGAGVVTAATPEQTRGYILTRFVDIYGRPVAFGFPGDRPGGTARPVFLNVEELRQSVNHQLLQAGWVYPTFYSKLYYDLRDDLAAATVTARHEKKGVWDKDATLPGFTLNDRDQLQTELVILPKLFRRLADYLTLEAPASVNLARFDEFLDAKDDRLFTIPAGQATTFRTLLGIDGQHLALTLPPEQIIFIEK